MSKKPDSQKEQREEEERRALLSRLRGISNAIEKILEKHLGKADDFFGKDRDMARKIRSTVIGEIVELFASFTEKLEQTFGKVQPIGKEKLPRSLLSPLKEISDKMGENLEKALKAADVAYKKHQEKSKKNTKKVSAQGRNKNERHM